MVQSVRKTIEILPVSTLAAWKRSILGIFFVMPSLRRVFVVGGSFVGFFVACVMKNKFLATIVDANEFFEFMTGVLRAYVKTEHLDAGKAIQLVGTAIEQIVTSCHSSWRKSWTISLFCRSCRFLRCGLWMSHSCSSLRNPCFQRS